MHVLMTPDYRRENPYQRLLADELATLGVTVTFPAGYRRILPVWRAVRDCKRRVDAVHLHWHEVYIRSHSRLGAAAYALKLILDLCLVKSGGRRIVWTVHNDLPHETKHPGLHRVLQRALARIADVAIFHSRSAVDQMKRLRLAERKVRVIPHGHYRDFYGPELPREEARRTLGLPENGRIYLHFGMMRPYKGVEELIRAWTRIAEEMAPARLLIAGKALDPAFEARLKKLAGGHPSTILRFGFVPDADVAAYFSAADFMVLPFRRSLTSGSLLLAMSYGVPVIGPELAFFSEAARDGLLYDPHAPGSLELALRKSALGPVARSRSGSRHDWKSIASATAGCYSRNPVPKPEAVVLNGAADSMIHSDRIV